MTRLTDDTTSIDELTSGFTTTADAHACLFCHETFTRGHIYRVGDDLLDAERAAQHHVDTVHGTAFQALLALGKKGTGLSDTQRTLLAHFHAGRSDREIQPLMGGVSASTIRNHRFALREKARQAKVFLALMALFEQGRQEPGARFIDIPGTKSADDERFAITRAEYDRIVKTHFPQGPDGPLVRMPKKEKRKIAVLIQILKRFDPERRYTQNEVNEILATASDDHTTLCRYLVDYGFMGRERDGSEYWVE
jgi:hypothetical protein